MSHPTKRVVSRVVAILVSAALLPSVVASIAHAGADDALPGLVVTTPAPDGFTSYGGMRLRAIGSTGTAADELLGVADLAVSGERIEANFTMPRFVANGNSGTATGDCRGNYSIGVDEAAPTNRVGLAWHPGDDQLVGTIANGSLDCTLTLSGVSGELAAAKEWTRDETADALDEVNALLVVVTATQPDASLVLRDATVDGSAAAGTFTSTAGATTRWLVTGYDFDTPGGFALHGKLDLQGLFNSCTDGCAVDLRFGHVTRSNEAPVVALEASDADGPEGGVLGTGGAFTDPDLDPLTITATGAGALVDHGDGTWSWTLAATDEDAGTVVVTADDGNGGTVEDRFDWTATNVAPTITALEPSATTVLANADVTWTATATDPGAGDALTWSFDGGASTGAGATTTTTTRYAACGTYTLAAAVDDGDGGHAEAVSATSVTVVGSSLLEPATTNGVAIGQRGRVLPLKLVVGCGGAMRGGLHPEVWMGGALVGRMQEQDGFYRFNLRLDGPGTVRIAPFGTGGGALEVPVRIR